MSKKKTNGHVRRLSKSMLGLQLAQAFVVIRREGFKTCVNKIDDKQVLLRPHEGSNQERINVNVVDGMIVKAWVG